VPHLEQDHDVLPVSILLVFLGDLMFVFNIITLKLTLMLRLHVYEDTKLSVFTPKMKPAGVSETVVNGYHTRRLQIPEGSNHGENFRSYIVSPLPCCGVQLLWAVGRRGYESFWGCGSIPRKLGAETLLKKTETREG
jgi:hypothetical protein